MNLHDWLFDLSSDVWPLAGNHIWQSTLFCGMAFVVAFLLRNSTARARHAAWLMASIKFALPSVALAILLGPPAEPSWQTTSTTPPAIFGYPSAEIVISESTDISNITGSEKHNELFCLITLAWAAGFAFVLIRWLQRRIRFARILHNSVPASHRETAALNRVIGWLGARKDIDLVVAPGMIEPGVWRIFNPVIVLPVSIADHLSDAELESVLMHEVIHVQRHDNLTGTLQMVLCAAFWFHPLVWLIDKRVLEARERGCDEEVCLLAGRSEIYASCLLKVLKHCIGLRMAGVSSAAGANLRRRIEEIMHQDERKEAKVIHRLVVAAMAASAIGFTVAAGAWSRNHVFARQNNAGAISDAPQGATGNNSQESEKILGQITNLLAPAHRATAPPELADTEDQGNNDATLGLDVSDLVDDQDRDVVKLTLEGADVDVREKRSYRITLSAQAIKDLKKAKLQPLAFNNDAKPPVIISDAKMRVVKHLSIFRRERGQSVHVADQYAIKPLVTLTNNSGQRVRGCVWELASDRSHVKGSMLWLGDTLIEPGASFTIDGYELSKKSFMLLKGDPTTFLVKVVGVIFENGERWGDVPPPPPPIIIRPSSGVQAKTIFVDRKKVVRKKPSPTNQNPDRNDR